MTRAVKFGGGTVVCAGRIFAGNVLPAPANFLAPRAVEEGIIAPLGFRPGALHAVEAMRHRREGRARGAPHIEKAGAPQPGTEALMELPQNAAPAVGERQRF